MGRVILLCGLDSVVVDILGAFEDLEFFEVVERFEAVGGFEVVEGFGVVRDFGTIELGPRSGMARGSIFDR